MCLLPNLIYISLEKETDSLPITVQIREVENGHPTPNILPYASKTLFPASINASTALLQQQQHLHLTHGILRTIKIIVSQWLLLVIQMSMQYG